MSFPYSSLNICTASNVLSGWVDLTHMRLKRTTANVSILCLIKAYVIKKVLACHSCPAPIACNVVFVSSLNTELNLIVYIEFRACRTVNILHFGDQPLNTA
jgi:hypothetical protein